MHSADIERGERTHEVMYLCASWNPMVVVVVVVVVVDVDDSDTSPPFSEGEPSATTPEPSRPGNFVK